MDNLDLDFDLGLATAPDLPVEIAEVGDFGAADAGQKSPRRPAVAAGPPSAMPHDDLAAAYG